MAKGSPNFGMTLGIPVWKQIVEKPMFGKPFARYGQFVMGCAYLFELGALLGRARQAKINSVAKMIASPGGEAELVAGLQEIAKTWLDQAGDEPESLIQVYMKKDLAIFGVSFSSPPKKLKEVFDMKIGGDDVAGGIQISTHVGVGFGSAYPDLTERLYRKAHEGAVGSWEDLRRSGVDLPRPEITTLEDGERIALSFAAEHAQANKPELVKELGLASYLGSGVLG